VTASRSVFVAASVLLCCGPVTASPVPAAGQVITEVAATATPPAGRWAWPLAPRPPVVHAFVPPESTYGAGHRGVDLGARVGDPVLAVADGTVTHVGVVAGRGTVSITHADGVRSTYEPVTAAVVEGQSLSAEDAVGSLEDADGHCAPAACLHLGALRDRTYLDPMLFLTRPRIVLLPPLPSR